MTSTQPIYQPAEASYNTDSKPFMETPQYESPNTESPLPDLDIDFSWGKMRSRISEAGTPKDALPTYVLHYNFINPTLVFKSGDDKETIATGNLHCISINTDCEIRGRAVPIKAKRRLHTEYAYSSHAMPNSSGGPSTMYWSGNSDLKQWHFVCMDENKLPVAKFSANWWSLTKVGKFQFLGAQAASEAARDELVATGITVFYTMVLRTQSLPSLLGALFSRPNHESNRLESEVREQELQNIDPKKTR